MRIIKLLPISAFAMTIFTTMPSTGQDPQDKKYPDPAPMTPQMTEFWTPQPRVVTPGEPDVGVSPPSDAIVLFSGADLSEWMHTDGRPVEWYVDGGIATVKAGTGDILTKRQFTDYQLHLEWRSPSEVRGESQGRGNSGVFMQDRYEIQILDSYDNETYNSGHAGSIYKQTPPLVNPMREPGRWNTYDVIYTAPRFKADGTLDSHARITLLFNGVVVQNNTLVLGTTEYIGLPKVIPHGEGPIKLQDHGDAVSFRNIWIREL